MRCRNLFFVWINVLVGLSLAGCQNSPTEATSPSAVICTSSPYLQATMNDLLGAGNQISTMLSLAGAGMCPGHMDIRPGQIQSAQKSKGFVRFDFQAGLDEKLFASADSGPTIKSIRVTGGLCKPDTYLSACEQAARILIDTGYSPEDKIAQRLDEIRGRISRLTNEVRTQMAASKMVQKPILASPHQADFCRFLGFDVLDTFTNEENMSIRRIDRIVADAREKKVSLIVANAPEGRKMADVLASYLKARVVVLDNFPDETSAEAFDALIRENLRRLMEK